MMANAAWRRGDSSNIERYLARADTIFQTMGEKYGQSRLRLLHAYLSLARDDPAEAPRLLREGLVLAGELGQAPYSLLIIGGCAVIAILSGKLAEAAMLFARASDLLEADAPHVDDGADAARAAYKHFLPELRNRLDARAFDAAWSEGRSLSLEDALGLAGAVVTESAQRSPDNLS